jgi:flagellar basal-body rod protein FlgG
VDSSGRIVAGTAGPITIPGGVAPSQLNITSDGSISAGETVIGKFRLVDFQDDENKLVPAGENCYQMPDPDVTSITAQNIVVKKGYQEASNVKMIDELVDMIMVARLYEANMKSVTATQEATSSILGVAMA